MRIARPLPDDLDSTQRALYEQIAGSSSGHRHTRADGTLRCPFNISLQHPRLGLPLYQLGRMLRYDGAVAPAIAEIAILMVATAHGCDVIWRAHASIAAEAGLATEEIRAIRESRVPAYTDPANRAAHTVAGHAIARKAVDDAVYAEIVAVLSVAEVIEITALVGYYSILASQMALFDVTYAEEHEQ